MKTLLTVIMLLVSSTAFGQAGHWYNADHPGHGIQINRDSGFGYAVTWYLYRKDGSTSFLSGEETCKEFPCIIPLVEPSAGFMGQGELELGEPVGTLELIPLASCLSLDCPDASLEVIYDLIGWIPECAGIGPGGLLLQKCIGSFEVTKLAD